MEHSAGRGQQSCHFWHTAGPLRVTGSSFAWLAKTQPHHLLGCFLGSLTHSWAPLPMGLAPRHAQVCRASFVGSRFPMLQCHAFCFRTFQEPKRPGGLAWKAAANGMKPLFAPKTPKPRLLSLLPGLGALGFGCYYSVVDAWWKRPRLGFAGIIWPASIDSTLRFCWVFVVEHFLPRESIISDEIWWTLGDIPPFLGFPDIFWTRTICWETCEVLHVSWFLLILLVLLAARCVSLGLSLLLIPDLFMLWKPIAHLFRFLWDCTRIGRNCCVACKGTSGGDWFRCGRNIKTGDTKMKPMLHIWRQNGEKPIEPTKAWADWAEIATCPVADFGSQGRNRCWKKPRWRPTKPGRSKVGKVESKKFWIDCMSHKGNSRCLVVVASFKPAQGRSGVSSAGWCFLGPYCSSQSLGAPAPRSLVGAGWCWLVLVGAGWCWLAKMKTVEKKLKSTNKHDLELPTEAWNSLHWQADAAFKRKEHWNHGWKSMCQH